MPQEPPEDRHAELEGLRAEVARLRERQASGGAESRGGGWWRALVSGLCLVLLVVTAPLAVVAVWAHDEVSDTDRYVETVAPLARDPAIQEAVSRRLTEEITSRLDVRALTRTAIDVLERRGVPPTAAAGLRALGTPLADAVDRFVAEKVQQLISSDEFASAWDRANREAHGQMVVLLTGDTDGAVEVTGNAVRLDLAVLIDAVRARLSDAGFGLVDRLPPISAQFTLVESADLGRAQTGFRLLSAASRALPLVALAMFVAAVAVSRRRRRALVAASLTVVVSMLLLGLTLNGFRVVYLDAIPADRLPADAAGAVYDRLVYFIRLNLRALLALFLAVAAVAWVTGPGPTPTAVRRGVGRGLDVVRRGRDRAGLDTGPVGRFLGRYRSVVRAVVAGAVVLGYVMTDHPTGAGTLWLLSTGAGVLLLAELLAGPPPSDGDEAAHHGAAGAPGTT